MTTVATPVFNPTGGQVAPGSTVEITCATVGATIYYTLGDTSPSTSWTEYTAAIDLPADSGTTTSIRAYAVNTGEDDSAVASATFYTVGYSAAVSAAAPAVLDTSASQGLGAVCEAIGLIGADGASVSGATYIGGASAPLVFETNAA